MTKDRGELQSSTPTPYSVLLAKCNNYTHLSILTLFPEYNTLSREIESWKGFAECLSPSDKEEFLKMLQNLYDYSAEINANSEPFPSEAVILALTLEQHKLIWWLKSKFDAKNE